MAHRVNPKLIHTLAKFGAEDVQNCYHCGNCSAVCHHADEVFVFPRKPMRLLQMGLEKRLEAALDPWLCYYCGQCSIQCPRGAEPGETMMSLRRWLTARYDLTGISRLFYSSWRAELWAILLLALVTGLGLTAWGLSHGDLAVYDGPGAFLPSSAIHLLDWGMAIVLGLLLLVNAGRMWWLTTGHNPRVKPRAASYLRALYLVPLHFLTQKRYARCDSRRPWLVHLALMLSYSTMLVLILFFLADLQSGPGIRWSVHAFGYLASAGLLGTVLYALRGRLRKTQVHYQHSHESDWIFLLMLLAVTVTGVLQHVLHRSGAEAAANLVYVLHLMLVVPMLVLEVPFSKWSHLAYRPLAIYFAAIHRDAQRSARERATEPGTSPPGGFELPPVQVA